MVHALFVYHVSEPIVLLPMRASLHTFMRAAQSSAPEADSLDQYMSTVSSQLDPVKRTELRHQLQELKKV